MDPSTRGPFIRGVVVALLLAAIIFGNAGFKRSGVRFDYDIESQTTLPDGREVEAHWSGHATESRGRRVYKTPNEEAPPVAVCAAGRVKHAQRRFEVSRRGRGEEIEGFRTRRYRISETDTIWFEGLKRPATGRIVTDYWMAPDLHRVAEPVLTFADSVIRSRIGVHEPRRSGKHSAREHKLPGTPLRIVSQAVCVDPHGKRYESETTSELTDIERPKFDFNF